CHQNFFPLGYALENFDPIGRWRTNDQIGPVDTSGAFVDGTSTNGIVELRSVLLQRPEAFRTTITENLLVYASGKPVSPAQRSPDPFIRARQILRSAQNPRWSAIIAAIVREKCPCSSCRCKLTFLLQTLTSRRPRMLRVSAADSRRRKRRLLLLI